MGNTLLFSDVVLKPIFPAILCVSIRALEK